MIIIILNFECPPFLLIITYPNIVHAILHYIFNTFSKFSIKHRIFQIPKTFSIRKCKCFNMHCFTSVNTTGEKKFRIFKLLFLIIVDLICRVYNARNIRYFEVSTVLKGCSASKFPF